MADPFSYIVGFSRRLSVAKEGLRVEFTEVMVNNSVSNLTAELFITDQITWNGSDFSCRAGGRENRSIHVCMTGKISLVILYTSLVLYISIRTSLSSHWAVSGVGPTISCGQFPVSSVW